MSAMLSALGSVKPAWEQNTPASAVPPLQSPVANVLQKDLSAESYHVGRARARGQLRVALETTSEAAQLRRLEQALKHPVVQYDVDVQKEISQVSSTASALSHRLRAQEEVSSAPQSETRDKIEELLAKAATPRDWPKPSPGPSSSQTSSSKSKPSKGAEAAAPKAAPQPVAAVEEDADECAEGGEGDLEEAALRIQSAFRGRMSRSEVEGLKQEKKEQEEMSAAATRIQANFRGRKTRENLAIGMEEEGEEGGEGGEGEDGPDQDY